MLRPPQSASADLLTQQTALAFKLAWQLNDLEPAATLRVRPQAIHSRNVLPFQFPTIARQGTRAFGFQDSPRNLLSREMPRTVAFEQAARDPFQTSPITYYDIPMPASIDFVVGGVAMRRFNVESECRKRCRIRQHIIETL